MPEINPAEYAIHLLDEAVTALEDAIQTEAGIQTLQGEDEATRITEIHSRLYAVLWTASGRLRTA